jgi:dolichol kinase
MIWNVMMLFLPVPVLFMMLVAGLWNHLELFNFDALYPNLLLEYLPERYTIVYLFPDILQLINLILLNTRLILVWIALIAFTVPLTTRLSSVNSKRKAFHLLLLIIYMSGLFLGNISGTLGLQSSLSNLDLNFLKLAVFVAFCVFAILECIRVRFGLDFGLQQYLRDANVGLIFDHFYLLVGGAVSIFVRGNLVLKASSIICLGVGDVLSSVIGMRYGTIRYYDSKKTIQGTVAFVVGLFGALLGLQVYCGVYYDSIELLICCVLTGILEGICKWNDNIVVPMYLCYMLVGLTPKMQLL